jgi:alpha-L-fucosidase 2
MMMKKCLLCILCFVFLNAFSQKLDYKNVLSKQELVFDSLSTKWEEGAFLGNGLLGVMVYREDDNAIRFDLGRTDVIDHRQGINPSIGRGRLPIGRFVLRTSSDIKKINLRLDLWNAELVGSITTDRGTIQLQALVPATKDIIVVSTTAGKNLFTWEWKPDPAVSPFLTLGRDSASKYPANPSPKSTKDKEGINYHFQPLLVGGGFTTAWKNGVVGNKQTQVISITNSRGFGQDTSWIQRQRKQWNLNKTIGWTQPDPSMLQAYTILKAVNSQSLQSTIISHRNYWHRFYQKSFISIPDKRLESFWWIQQYKMASATRVGALGIDLMGPWYKPSPWPKYWWNLNIQLTYYPFFSSNHIDLVKPLLKMINDNIDNLSKNAPQPYQHNSAALARSGPYDMVSPIKVLKGNDSTGSSASLELGNLTWLLHVCWQAYEHTMDKKFIQKLYPVLKRAINYYIHIAEKGSDGKYHLPYTYSPEYPKGITRDANYDLSVLRWGLKTLLYSNKQLNKKDALETKWKDLLNNLVDYPKDEYGFRVGRDAAFTQSHRHYSHLLMVYPIYEINWDQQHNRDLILRSLNQWKNNDAAWRGYSYTGSGSIYAMMGEGDSTWKMLNEMMKGRFSIKPNTMYLEAGPVIETPLSAVTTMNEMLLQSWGGVIRVFPAIPISWKESSFDKLLAKDGFEVAAVRKNGKTSFIKIKSLAGQPCIVKTDLQGDIKASGKRKFTVIKKDDGSLIIDLKKGEEVFLYTGQKPASFTLTESAGDNNFNYWGLHQQK